MEIINLIANVTLDGPLDLELLHKKLQGSELIKSKSGWIQYRLKPEMRYIGFYQSGKFLMTGKGLYNNLQTVSERVLKVLEEAGVKRKVTEIEIYNIVGKEKIKNIKPLELIFLENKGKSEYEPEQFPALIFRDWNLTFLLFRNGSTIITGAKTADQIKSGLKKFIKLVQPR